MPTPAERYLGVSASKITSQIDSNVDSIQAIVTRVLAILHAARIRPNSNTSYSMRRFRKGICRKCSNPILAQGMCSNHIQAHRDYRRDYYYRSRGLQTPPHRSKSGPKPRKLSP